MARRPIEIVLKEHADELMSLPGVVGIAIGEKHGAPCIVVFKGWKTLELLQLIPSEIEGYAVTVEETGEFRPLCNSR